MKTRLTSSFFGGSAIVGFVESCYSIVGFFFFFLSNERLLLQKKNIVTFSIKAFGKKAVEKKKESNPRLENQPNFKPDFLGRVGFRAAKLDFYQVGFRVIVIPTQLDPISVLLNTSQTRHANPN